jgi:hypothetical protein
MVARFVPLNQIAPSRSSAGCEVTGVFSELGERVFPTAVDFWSNAAGVRPENSLALAAAPEELEGKLTVMTSVSARAVTLCAEQIATRPPLVFVRSASTP